ncbi:DUF5107 domain-containing protein [Agromyces seonyuensis]|uniref:DUF5107 domain-containing protein n=1 Tax=Agromyces seonyuensis TaxID=2662446 RepID=A0A6I4NZ05_9MICO|nr:DUF5107 domain-containing protein [Agromyces seonyuensis]MWB96969.1 DUF5107 domain-containing protein [Agromyces seonyuensis]
MSDRTSHIRLPAPPPAEQALLDDGGVACWEEDVEIDTYEPGAPDRFPMFFDHRVYQGSDGRVYPLPFVDRIETEPVRRTWKAIHLENRWVRLMLLPEIGGRIHIGYDKTRDYDFFYRNNVIKPALVGLGGPWISGGVEFNWPQHHRPGTYLPVDVHVERGDDGSATVWHSDLDPLQRMRGTHGVRLRPDSSTIEVEAKLFNRTDEPQTFLWWANVAAAVHEEYQSFFPTDVRYVADHARRAITAFPRADRPYYGVDYPELAAHDADADRLDVYSHIPVPTSYMVTETADEFFGGYDHRAGAGFVHWADRDIAPGKKQWTWGNGPIGHAWDRQLTDGDGPYVELMAGVFTDNQPDFSYLLPGETRSFSQFWYPIQDVGVIHQASRDAALSVRVDGTDVVVGIAPSRPVDAEAVVELEGRIVARAQFRAEPGSPYSLSAAVPPGTTRDDLVVTVHEGGRELVTWRRHAPIDGEPWAATEPPAAASLDSIDELLLTAQHLVQYRHPTRAAEPYLRRALELDPDDSRAHLALAELALVRGSYDDALGHVEDAARRLTRRNLNPRTGELHYRRGLVLERLGDLEEAARSFAKAGWDGAFAVAARLGLARVLLRLGRNEQAEAAAARAVELDAANTTAIAALVLARRRLGAAEAAASVLDAARAADPLDPFLAALAGDLGLRDPRTALTIAQDFARHGEVESSLEWAARSELAGPTVFGNTGPVAGYTRALVLDRAGRAAEAVEAREAARRANRDLAFPAGLDDLDALTAAIAAGETAGEPDTVALGLLGSLLLGVRRHEEARDVLVAAVLGGSDDPVVLRNAAVAVANTGGDLDLADGFLAQAFRADGPVPSARLVYERDQLARLRGIDGAARLAAIESSGVDVFRRDDLTIAVLGLLLDVDRVEEARAILASRRFQPFEGGEGLVIAAFDRATLVTARRLLDVDPAAAAALLEAAVDVPENLGEGRHPADPAAELLVLAGDAHLATGAVESAEARWRAARDAGGPLAVAPRPARPDDFWIGAAHLRLGEYPEADAVWAALDASALALEDAYPTPDYFATSLPETLLFAVDDARGRTAAAAELREAASRGRALSAERAEVRA